MNSRVECVNTLIDNSSDVKMATENCSNNIIYTGKKKQIMILLLHIPMISEHLTLRIHQNMIILFPIIIQI